jgi:hypothetical protein
MTFVRDRPIDPSLRLRSRADAFVITAAVVLSIALIVVGAIGLVRYFSAPAPQRFTAPPFTLDFAAVLR